MALTRFVDPEASAPLVAALRDPLGQESRRHVEDWLAILAARFPLWSFQAWAYAPLQRSKLPTNYPLQDMINSILRDEGLHPDVSTNLEPLTFAVDRRRYDLADEGEYGGTTVSVSPAETGPYERLPLRRGSSRFNRLYPLAFIETFDHWTPEHVDSETGQPVGWPYAEIGRALVGLTRTAEATDRETRRQARADLKQFLKSLGVARGKGSPGQGPKAEVLRSIVRQGTKLLSLCSDALPPERSAKTLKVWADLGVSDLGEQKSWVVQLALPVFSAMEIRWLLREVERAKVNYAPEGRTPWSLAVSLVAHRLQLPAKTVARKVSG